MDSWRDDFLLENIAAARDELVAARKALKVAQAAGDRGAEARAGLKEGRALFALGSVDEAIAVLEPIPAVAQSEGDPTIASSASNTLAMAHLILADLARCVDYHTRAVALLETRDDPAATGLELGELAIAYELVGDNERARERASQAERMTRGVRTAWHQAAKGTMQAADQITRVTLLQTVAAQFLAVAAEGQVDTARRVMESGLTVARRLSDYVTARVLFEYGRLLALQGDLRGAAERLTEALHLLEPREDRSNCNDDARIVRSALAAVQRELVLDAQRAPRTRHDDP